MSAGAEVTARFLCGPPLLAAGAWLEGHGVLIEGGVIRAILPEGEAGHAERVALPRDALLAPGLIDIQVNGGGGVLFNDQPTAEAAVAIAAAHRRLGTTAILPTLITDTPEAMAQAAGAALAAITPWSGVIGIHYEGPFLSPHKPGVHLAALIRQPGAADLALLEDLARRLPGPVLLTLAPECVDDAALLRLAEAGVVLSAGHTAAPFERLAAAAEAGLAGFTHVFNAMPPLGARDPGAAGAALDLAEAWCGVIADGVHVHPALLRLLLARKRPDRIILVSDAMPPAGTTLDRFELQGRTIRRAGGRLVTADGVLAGADLSLLDAVRSLVSLTGASLAAALGMASAVPAAFLRMDHRLGRIAPGCRADLILLTPGLQLLGTWLAGAWRSA